MATIYDVARQAGVSIKTVSRVINGSPQVRENTRQRVLAAIRALQYEPNVYARSMAARRTQVIGVYRCGPMLRSDSQRFFSMILERFESRLAGTGYRMLLDSAGLHARGGGLGTLARQVDGILIINYPEKEERAEIAGLLDAIPLVTIGRRRIRGRETHAVGPDNAHGVELAVRHLGGLGHRQIGLVLDSRHGEHNVDRLRAFRRALAEMGLSPRRESVVLAEPGPARADLLRRWLSSPGRPTAVFVAGERSALEMLGAARAVGLVVPGDLAIVTHEDSYAAQLAAPPLTVIRRRDHRIGQEAATMLLRLIAGQEVAPRTILIPGELIVRASCGAPASGVRSSSEPWADHGSR